MDERKTIDIINEHEVNLNEVYQYLEQGKKIEAVKYIKVQTGMSLKETKAYVDRLNGVGGIKEETDLYSEGIVWGSASENDIDKPIKKLYSSHNDITKYPVLEKVVSIFAMWAVWGAIFRITHIPSARAAILQFIEENHTVDWLVFWSDIILNDLHYVAIFILIGTAVILMKKKKYSCIKIYNQGIGFTNIKTHEEIYAIYEDITIYYRRGNVCMKCKKLKVDVEFKYDRFTMPDVMRNNLERFATLTM